MDYARGLAEELWKDRQPGEPDRTVFMKNAEGIIDSAPR
jgi:ATP-dependent DNA ligase